MQVTLLNSSLPPSFPQVQVRVRFVKDVPLGSDEAVQVYNILFGRVMKELKLVQFQRSHFDPKAAISKPHLKLEIWPGYVTSVAEHSGGLLLCCDVRHRVLRSTTALEVMEDTVKQAQKSNENQKAALLKQMLGEIVLTR